MSTETSTNRLTYHQIFPYLLILVGFTLRLYRIGYQSIWWDEAASIHTAQGGLGAVWALPGSVSYKHTPLHRGMLVGWTQLTGFSELSVRYLSLLFGVLLLPVVYRVTRRLFDQPTALAAMALTALAPLYVTYSQEARVYALLPLLYLLLIHALHRLTETGRSAPPWLWLELAILEALIFYSHPVAALGVLYINLALLAVWIWQRRISLWRWIGSQVLAAALFAPWLWNIALHWSHIRARIGTQEWSAVPPTLPAFLLRIWRFNACGNLLAAEDSSSIRTAAAVVAVTGALALLLAWPTDSRRRTTGAMLAHGLVPLAFCFGLWQIWPQSQPRYTLVFSIPFFVVAGRVLSVLLAGRAWQRVAGATFACSLALNAGCGLYVQYFVETFHKDDAQGVAAYLEQSASATDVILIDPDDYSAPYYYDGPAAVEMARRDDPLVDKAQHLSEITTNRQRLFLVHWKPSKADLHELRPFLLEQAGRLEAWEEFRGLDVRAYVLEGPTGPLADLAESETRFGPLLLTGIFYEPSATTDGAIAAALRWRLVEPTDAAYKAVVMLTDASGHRLTADDVLLLDESGLPTHLWTPGTEATNFYVVPVPVGTPPLLHRMVVGVYDAATLARLPLTDEDGESRGQDFFLGEVALTPGEQFDRDPYGTWTGVPWEMPGETTIAEGLALEQFAIRPRAALPGGQVEVLLRWRAEGATRPTSAPLLRLYQEDEIWAEVGSPLLADTYPPDDWATGEVVVERRVLTYPPRRVTADLAVATDHGLVPLGQVYLDETTLLWEPPAMEQRLDVQIGSFAHLLGYDLETVELAPGQPFRLTLYWQALNDAPLTTAYTVFTQLLETGGRLIAQHDGPPVDNTRPTTTWVGGEVVVDAHTLTFTDPTYTGPATLIVGLYDSATVSRAITDQGQDHVSLPAHIVVTATSQ